MTTPTDPPGQDSQDPTADGPQGPGYGQQAPLPSYQPGPEAAGQSPYGPPPAYGDQPYGFPPSGAGQQQSSYAGWWVRVGASLLDGLVESIPYVIGIIIAASSADSSGTMSGGGILAEVVGGLISLGILVWNRWLRAGRTGQSLGKTWTGIWLLSEQTGQPIGAGKAFLRDLCHFLDSICYIGYIVAAFDSKTQTFADKIMKTVVVKR